MSPSWWDRLRKPLRWPGRRVASPVSTAWLQRLRKPALRRAATHWLRRQQARRPRDHEFVTPRLAADWRHLARVYGDGANPGHFFALFSALGALPPTRLPPTHVVRYYLRSLRAHPTADGWGRLRRHLAGDLRDGPAAIEAWRRELHALRADRSARHEHAVTFEEMRESLEILVLVLFPDVQRLVLEPDARWVRLEVLTASTDGRRVMLPSSVAVAANRQDNAMAYVGLLFHELAHISEGTFALTREDLMRGPLAERMRAAWASGLMASSPPSGGSPLEHVFRAAARPQLLHGIFNVVEDQRIEAALGERFPLYGRLERWLTSLERRHQSPTAISSAEQLLFSGLMALAAGRARSLPIAPRHQSAYAQLKARIERSPPRALSHVAQTLELAIDLYEILLTICEADEALATLIEARADDNDLVAAKRTHDREDPEEVGGEHVHIPHRPESDIDLGVEHFDYPEWNADAGALEPDVARVHLFGRGRPKVQSPSPEGSSAFAFTASAPRRVARHRSEGFELDAARAYDFAVGRRVGRDTEDRVFRARRYKPTPRARSFDFVLDVSTSFSGGLPWIHPAAVH